MENPSALPLTLPPLSLYIHIPWCIKKCPYCDFNSHENHGNKALGEKAYITALKNDLQHEQNWLAERHDTRQLHSIFFGGGTPSLFSAEAIGEILRHAEKIIGFEDDIEINLEANPSTFEQNKFSGFYAAGVNRLSIGIQSFQAHHLSTLGRIHNADEAKNAVLIAKAAGFTNINIDLMHGLPEQTAEEALEDIRTALSFSPQHISWYQLTIEPNTQFYSQPPPLPEDDTLGDIQEQGMILLHANGFEQYEVSAFSQQGRQSKHNNNYWRFGDYIGIGAGAHGKLSDLQKNHIIRRQKTRLPEHYLQTPESPKYKQHIVVKEELPIEFMMNALRLKNGVASTDFEERTGLALASINKKLALLIAQALLVEEPNRLATTPLGYQFLNTVLEKLSDAFFMDDLTSDNSHRASVINTKNIL